MIYDSLETRTVYMLKTIVKLFSIISENILWEKINFDNEKEMIKYQNYDETW